MSQPTTYTIDSALRGTPHVEQLQSIVDGIRSGNTGEGVPSELVGGEVVTDELTGFRSRARTDDPGTLIQLHAANGRANAIIPALITAPGTYVVDPNGANHLIVNSTLGAIEILLPDLSAEGAVPMFVTVLHIAGSNPVTVVGDGQSIGQFDSVAGVPLPKIGDLIVLWAAPDEWSAWQFYTNASRGVTTLAGSGDIASTDVLVLVDTSGGAAVAQLPSAIAFAGDELIVKQVNGSAGVDVTPASGEQIDSLGADVEHNIAAQNEVVRLRSDGVQWWRV